MISREEAIEKATGVLEEAYKGVCYVTEVDVEWLITAIEALSNERPKGRWGEPYEIRGFDIVGRDCSECGYTSGELGSNFCPNCGADMREGEEE